MSVRVMTRDTEALPDDLLSLAKEHMRVDHSEDNNFIKSVHRAGHRQHRAAQ